MLKVLQTLTAVFILAIIIGTGRVLVFQGGWQYLWQLYWIGFVIWLWGMIILIRLKPYTDEEEEDRAKYHSFFKHEEQMDKLKMAAVSTLIAITFFYSSISWLFQDNMDISLIILFVTFLVSFYVQNAIHRRTSEEEEEEW